MRWTVKNFFIGLFPVILAGTWISCECISSGNECLTQVITFRLVQEGNDVIFGENPLYHPDSIKMYSIVTGNPISFAVLPDMKYIQFYTEPDSIYIIEYDQIHKDTLSTSYTGNLPCCTLEGVDEFTYNGRLQCQGLECSFSVIEIENG